MPKFNILFYTSHEETAEKEVEKLFFSFLKKTVHLCLSSAGKVRLPDTQTAGLFEDPKSVQWTQPVTHPVSERTAASVT